MKLLTGILLLLLMQGAARAQNITQLEYFVDTDLGVGQNTRVNVTPSADGNFPFTVKTTGLSIGMHKLYIRTKNSDGKWSITARRNFEIIPNQAKKTIVAGEYFFDTDPGMGAAAKITISPQDSVIMQSFTAQVTGLQPGYHKLYTRFKDNQGNWGHTMRRNVEVIKSPDSNYLQSVEYFIGSDPGVGMATKLSVASIVENDPNNLTIPFTCIQADSLQGLYFRVQDAKGNWSLTTGYANFKLTDKGVVTNVKNGLWSDASTWSNGKVPDINTAVYLSHDLTVDVNGVCKFLNMQCRKLTVNANRTLRIAGTD
ncbi:hypothetical protein [Foetidibacter luteolus]|uniref:hypothetical protein n=1 Tax=Foetidibacter luteolus TaxID=2608880 RepID=UPI00129BAD6B|nr:hypothetical protein [Foetidibacter luteolus]